MPSTATTRASECWPVGISVLPVVLFCNMSTYNTINRLNETKAFNGCLLSGDGFLKKQLFQGKMIQDEQGGVATYSI